MVWLTMKICSHKLPIFGHEITLSKKMKLISAMVVSRGMVINIPHRLPMNINGQSSRATRNFSNVVHATQLTLHKVSQ